MIDRIEEIKNYRKLVSQANKESIKKEAFKDLMNRLFAHHEETKRIVDTFTSGAEKPILIFRAKTRFIAVQPTRFITKLSSNLKTT